MLSFHLQARSFVLPCQVTVGFLLVTLGCAPSVSQRLDPKEVVTSAKYFTANDSYVRAVGSWRQTGFNEIKVDPYVPTLNEVDLTCGKHTGICREIGARLRLPYILDPESSDIAKPFLSVYESEWEIVFWENGVLKAQRLLPVQDRDLEISFADESVEMRIAETKARGSDTADPDIREEYVLDDGLYFRSLDE